MSASSVSTDFLTEFTYLHPNKPSSMLDLLLQANPPADFMRSIGKIYVVVAVIVVVFLGLAYYLWSMDRRLTELEKDNSDHA